MSAGARQAVPSTIELHALILMTNLVAASVISDTNGDWSTFCCFLLRQCIAKSMHLVTIYRKLLFDC